MISCNNSKSVLVILAVIQASILSHSQTAHAEQLRSLDPEIILRIRRNHLSTCVPTVSQQLSLAGLDFNKNTVEGYCGCLGVLYFNEMTRDDYHEMMRNGDRLPIRIARQRSKYQDYCADVHF